MQTGRTKAKLQENLALLKTYLENEYGRPVSGDTERILFNALDWTADDVQTQSVVAAPQLENRSNKDYAIEHGEYLAKAATEFLKVSNERAKIGEESDSMEDLMNADEVLADHRSALESAVYEFRKRAKRALAGAAALPSQPKDSDYRAFAGEMASYDFEPSLELDEDQSKRAASVAKAEFEAHHTATLPGYPDVKPSPSPPVPSKEPK